MSIAILVFVLALVVLAFYGSLNAAADQGILGSKVPEFLRKAEVVPVIASVVAITSIFAEVVVQLL